MDPSPVGLGVPAKLAVFAQPLVCQGCQLGAIPGFKRSCLGKAIPFYYDTADAGIICI